MEGDSSGFFYLQGPQDGLLCLGPNGKENTLFLEPREREKQSLPLIFLFVNFVWKRFVMHILFAVTCWKPEDVLQAELLS